MSLRSSENCLQPLTEMVIRFTQADIRPFAENILMALFANIEKGGTPEKIAENDYLMKCMYSSLTTSACASDFDY